MTAVNLASCLAEVPAFAPLGVQLLQQLRVQTGAWLPATKLDPATVAAATLEILEYTRQCAVAIRKLRALLPVPLTQPILEVGL